MVKILCNTEISRTPEVERANPMDETLKTGGIFQINNAKLYISLCNSIMKDSKLSRKKS